MHPVPETLPESTNTIVVDRCDSRTRAGWRAPLSDVHGWLRWRLPHLYSGVRAPWWNALRLRWERTLEPKVPVKLVEAVVEGRLLRLLYAGHEDGLRYIQPFVQDQLFGEAPTRVWEWRMHRRDLARSLSSFDVDLAVTVLEKDLVAASLEPQSVLMPFRIHQVVDTSRGWPQVREHISRGERARHLRQSERHGFRLRASHSDEEYRWFYERMVRPSMAVRYGDRDRSLEEPRGLHAIFRHGVLFMVDSGAGPVAGSASELDRRRGIVNGRLIGVRDGDQLLRKEGAQNALYHFILRWACENGFRCVDYQGCEPFLSKGTFQYKKRFGTTAVLPPSRYRFLRVVLTPGRDSERLRDFLAANPVMLVDDQDRLGSGYFTDRHRPPRYDIPDDSAGFHFRRDIDMDELLGALASGSPSSSGVRAMAEVRP
jgi:hypothetical protein